MEDRIFRQIPAIEQHAIHSIPIEVGNQGVIEFMMDGIIFGGELPRKIKGKRTSMKMDPAISDLLVTAAVGDPRETKVATASTMTPIAIRHASQVKCNCSTKMPTKQHYQALQ